MGQKLNKFNKTMKRGAKNFGDAYSFEVSHLIDDAADFVRHLRD